MEQQAIGGAAVLRQMLSVSLADEFGWVVTS